MTKPKSCAYGEIEQNILTMKKAVMVPIYEKKRRQAWRKDTSSIYKLLANAVAERSILTVKRVDRKTGVPSHTRSKQA